MIEFNIFMLLPGIFQENLGDFGEVHGKRFTGIFGLWKEDTKVAWTVQ